MKNLIEEPIRYTLIFFFISLICISFPVSWIFPTSEFLGSIILRALFSIIGMILIVMCGFECFKINRNLLKNIDIVFMGLIIAINNFPIFAIMDNKVIFNDISLIQLIEYIIFCFFIALFEELFFRGLIYNTFFYVFKDKKNRTILCILVSSAIFGLTHIVNLFGGGNFGAVFLQIGYTFLNGMLYAILYYFTKNIYISIMCHFVFNTGGLFTNYNLASGEIWYTKTILITLFVSLFVVLYLCIRYYLIYRKSMKIKY